MKNTGPYLYTIYGLITCRTLCGHGDVRNTLRTYTYTRVITYLSTFIYFYLPVRVVTPVFFSTQRKGPKLFQNVTSNLALCAHMTLLPVINTVCTYTFITQLGIVQALTRFDYNSIMQTAHIHSRLFNNNHIHAMGRV